VNFPLHWPRTWLSRQFQRTFGGMHVESMPSVRPDGTTYDVTKSDEQWREELDPAEYFILRQAGTERPYIGEFVETKTIGTYLCRACNAELFSSDTKFDSHCGWPSFWSPLAGESVIELEDTSAGMRRVEVRCASCGSHLGHVFDGEGYGTPTDQRYCINSISLKLTPASS